ncbi:fec operon regulator FecR [compost metagenome]
MINTMKPSLHDERTLAPLEQQAYAWVRQVATGKMTHADGIALKRWCAQSKAHASAFSAAHHRWQQLGQAGELLLARNPAARQASSATPSRVSSPARRAFLGGAVCASAAAAAVVVFNPPLELWPSLAEMKADYRTATGEQRKLALADNINVELNTRTSIAVKNSQTGVAGIDLIAGEAAVDLANANEVFVVAAGAGRTTAQNAQFEVKYLDKGICVTCLQGRVQVAHAAGRMVLSARQQLIYDDQTLGNIASIDAASVSSWREGSLRFKETPLAEVVAEINRYRPGRVMLLDKKMAAKAVTGRFRLDALDQALAQIQLSLGLQSRKLPGGMVLLS